jgi:hypothetical protein
MSVPIKGRSEGCGWRLDYLQQDDMAAERGRQVSRVRQYLLCAPSSVLKYARPQGFRLGGWAG